MTLMGFYICWVLQSAIIAASILNRILKIKSKSYFVIEMPDYQHCRLFKNVVFHIIEKTKGLSYSSAGKIILAISILLWILASYGPTKEFTNAEADHQK